MENDQIKQIIMQELPGILERDPEVQAFILRLSRQHFADKAETENRFDRLLEELRHDREENSRKWEENQRDLAQIREESNRRWEENARRWEEQNRKWEENQQEIRQLFEEIKTVDRRYDSTIGALGARWGVHSEQSFRNALKGILEDFSEIEVVNVTEYDDAGEVFGRPDQIELDLIIKNGLLIICEIKSSMSKADMYLFERKARFYEKRHNRQAERLIVISPMVDDRAKTVAERLGIEIYSYAEDAGSTLAPA